MRRENEEQGEINKLKEIQKHRKSIFKNPKKGKNYRT